MPVPARRGSTPQSKDYKKWAMAPARGTPEKTALNVYWDCMQGTHMKDPDQTFMTFEEVESQFYRIVYHESVEAQNERNIRNRHPERNRTTEDLLKDRRTCPEETILQIGNISGTVPAETLTEIVATFFSELTSRYGEHFHILDWALHLDENTGFHSRRRRWK